MTILEDAPDTAAETASELLAITIAAEKKLGAHIAFWGLFISTDS